MTDYWRIFAEEVPADMGLELTPEQIDYLTDALKGAHDNYSTAHGHDVLRQYKKDERPRLKLRKPINTASSSCRSTGYYEEYWSVHDDLTGHSFGFSGPNAGEDARLFYERNSR